MSMYRRRGDARRSLHWSEMRLPGREASRLTAPGESLRGADIVCVGLADWDAEVPTSQHHLMRRLARFNRILFVESLGLRRPQIAERDLQRMARRVQAGLAGPVERDGLHVLSPLVLPVHGTAPV